MQVLRHQVKHGTVAYGWSHQPCAQPLVVLHGLGDSSIQTYAPRFADSVLKHTPALFIDLPGFGESTVEPEHPGTLEELAENVISLLRANGVTGAPLFAHSMGANIALIVSEREPTLLRQLILAEPLLDSGDSVLAAGIAKHSEESFVSRGHAMLLRATSLQAHRGDVAAAAFLPVVRMAQAESLHRAAVSLLQPRVPDFASLIRRVDPPIHLLFGGNTPGDRSGFHHAALEITEVPNAGHFMIAEQCYATACAILNIVNRTHYGGI